ncbi:MAG: radical SAM protein [Elusimicrobia bacterium]|nr:radical SAM protein [Elusimicrobiota bacterium]
MDLFVTDRCNQACVFCYLYSPEFRSKGGAFPMRDVTSALDAGRKRGYEEVYISGGEPTVCRDFARIVREARERGYLKVKVMTNGVRFADPEFAGSLADAGLTHVALSVHGPTPAVYAATHGRGADLGRVVKAVQNLKSLAPGLSLEVNAVTTAGNVDALPALGRWVEAMGLERLHVQLLVPNSRASAAHFPGHRRAAEAFLRLVDAWGRRLRLNCAFFPPCTLPGREDLCVEFDFTTSFFTNRPDMILSWQRSLLAAKRTVPACEGCPWWRSCRGFWLPED